MTKGHRSNFDGVWPPKPKPASKPADPAFKNALRQRPMRIGLRSIGGRLLFPARTSATASHLQVATAMDVFGAGNRHRVPEIVLQLNGRASRLIGGEA